MHPAFSAAHIVLKILARCVPPLAPHRHSNHSIYDAKLFQIIQVTSKTRKILKNNRSVHVVHENYFLKSDEVLRSELNDLNGDPGKTRTCDPLLRRQMLYPTELRDRVNPKNKKAGVLF